MDRMTFEQEDVQCVNNIIQIDAGYHKYLIMVTLAIFSKLGKGDEIKHSLHVL